MSDKDVNDILNGVSVHDFVKTESEEAVRKLNRAALSRKQAVQIKIDDAKRSPDLKYSADENDAFVLRLTKLRNFFSMVEAVTRDAICELNHKNKMQNKRDAAAAGKLKALRRAISEHCPEEIRRKIFATYDIEQARIENKFFPESEVA